MAEELTVLRPQIIVAPRAWRLLVLTVGTAPDAEHLVAKMLRSAAFMAAFSVVAAD